MHRDSIIPIGLCQCGCGAYTRTGRRFLVGHNTRIVSPRTGTSRSPVDRFWDLVAKSPDPDDCWLWTGATNRGYGAFSVKRRYVSAHRFSYELHYGPLGSGEQACHKCDIKYPMGDWTYRRCVRPEHLFKGTHADNMRDKVSKGRHVSGLRLHPERAARGDRNASRLYPERRPRGDSHFSRTRPELCPCGEQNGRAKLTDDDVIAIRAILRFGHGEARALAAKYGVHRSTLLAIRRRLTWKHLPAL